MVYRIKDYISTESTEENVADTTVEPLEQRIIDTVTSTDLNQEVEDKMEDIAESEFTLNNTLGEIDAAMESIDSLNTLISSLESIKENGGFTQESLLLYNTFRKDIYKKTGISVQCTSLEAFDDYSRVTQIKLSLEEEQANKKNILQKIWEFLSNLFKSFVKFLKEVFSIQGALKREIEQLKREISNKSDADFQGKVPEDRRLSLAGSIIIDGQINIVDNAKKFPDILKRVNINEVSKITLNALSLFKQDIDQAIKIYKTKSGETPKSHWEETNKQIVDALIRLFPLDSNLTSEIGIYDQVYASEELPGGSRVCVGYYQTPEEDGSISMPSLLITRNRLDERIQPKDVYLEVTSKRDAISVLDNILKTIDTWMKISEEAEKVTDKAQSITSQIKSATSGMSDDIKNTTGEVIKYYQKLLSGYISFNQKINNIMLATCKASISVVRFSLSKRQQNDKNS